MSRHGRVEIINRSGYLNICIICKFEIQFKYFAGEIFDTVCITNDIEMKLS